MRVVGNSLVRVDAFEKVTGFVQYAGDIKLPDMLYAKLLRSPFPHAEIVSINAERAERLLGVKAIVSYKNAPRIKFNSSCPVLQTVGLPLDQLVFPEKARFAGEPVAAVAAVDIDTAEEALSMIDVNYKPLPFVLNADAAMRPDAPQIHNGHSNIFSEISYESGDFDKSIEESEHVFRGKYSTTSIQHCALEPHVCVSRYDDSGKLTVWASTQIPFRLRTWLSRALGLPVGKVRIIRPPIGGGFGGKEEMVAEPYSALLAMRTRRPVRLEYTREEEFTAGRRRHASTVELETGVDKDGFFKARGINALLQAGGYASHASLVLGLMGAVFRMMYKSQAARFNGKCVYTNTTPGGALRGYGGPQAVFPVERQVDEICRELNLDPLEFRLKNSFKKGDTDPVSGQIITSGANEECLFKGAAKVGWNTIQSRTQSGDIRRGIGVARYMYPTSAKGVWPESSEAFAIVNEDGSVNIVTSAVDMGTGISTGLVQIAAEELRVGADKINITLESDTDTNPFDLGAYASKVTFVAGGAVRLAAEEARHKLLAAASQILKVDLNELDTREGYVCSKLEPNRRISFGEIVTTFRYAASGSTSIMGRGFFEPPGNAPVFGAQFAEVEVDCQTGRTKVLRIVAALDVGRAINPANIEGQVHGAIHMGLGSALSEFLSWDKSTGKIQNSSFLDYKVFTAPDMPKIDVIILEYPDPSGPYGAKGVGEQATLPTAAAVANAVSDAVGVSLRELPLTSERVYRRIHNLPEAE
jgi:xanthine dehydrogenase molybdenum-binding subunit